MSDLALLQIERWQAAAVAQAAEADSMEMVPIGPFRAMIDLLMDDVGFSMAIPAQPPADDGSAAGAIDEVCRAFRERRRVPHFEFSAGAWPALGRLLERAGLRLESNHPLMACRPEEFRPRRAADVLVQILGPDDADADLSAFHSVRMAGLEPQAGGPQPNALAQVRQAMGRGAQFALGRVDGAPAGSALLTPLEGAGEIAGVATLPEFRRRGVAATVTSRLMGDFFQAGGRLAWLDAEDEVAGALYAGLGFRVVGTWSSYVAG